MKTKVRVTLTAETEVIIEVEHQEDENPFDLTQEEERRAIDAAPPWAAWEVDMVGEVKP